MDESLIVGFRAGYTTTMRKQKISRYLKTTRRHLKKWLRVFCNLRPLGHLKGITMKFMDKSSPSLGGLSLWRISHGVAALLVAFTLAACGGGGGGSTSGPSAVNPPAPEPPASSPTNPPMPPSGKLSVEPSDKCVVTKEGEGNCPRTLRASDLKNTTGKLAIFGPNDQSWPANNAGVPVVAPLGESVYRLVDDKTELAKVTVTVSCGSDLVEQGKNCVKKDKVVLHYDVIVAMTGGTAGVPVQITGESCAAVKVQLFDNQTSFPERPEWNFALFNSMVYETISPKGWLKVAAQVVADSNKLHGFLYNPESNELVDDDGSQGAIPSLYPLDDGWHRVSEDNNPDPRVGGWAQSDKLFVYVTRENGNQPLCEDVVKGVRSGKPSILPITEEMETFGGLFHFKN